MMISDDDDEVVIQKCSLYRLKLKYLVIDGLNFHVIYYKKKLTKLALENYAHKVKAIFRPFQILCKS